LACMQILLDAGADTSITSDVCPTALHTAVVWGNVEAAGLLLEAGAAASALSKWGRTPLDLLSDVDGDGTIPHAFQLRTLLLDKGGKHAAQVVNA
jgi:ankyrin repeat protein